MDLIVTILMLTSVTCVTAVTLGCPSNLVNSQYLRHFGTHCYQFILNRHEDWAHADTDCRGKGGYLVDIHSNSEQAFIYNTLQILGLHGDKGVWIGLTDKDREGTWIWTSGTNVNYKNWGSGQPGLFGGTEDCALLERNGHWGDYPCHGVLFLRQNHGWICKFGEVPLTTKAMSTMSTTATQKSTTMKIMESSTLMSTLASTHKPSTMSSTSMTMTTSAIHTMMSSSTLKPMTSLTYKKTSSTPMATTVSSTPMHTTISSTPMDTTVSSTPMATTVSSTPMDTTTTSIPMDTSTTSPPMSSPSDVSSKQTMSMTTL